MSLDQRSCDISSKEMLPGQVISARDCFSDECSIRSVKYL